MSFFAKTMGQYSQAFNSLSSSSGGKTMKPPKFQLDATPDVCPVDPKAQQARIAQSALSGAGSGAASATPVKPKGKVRGSGSFTVKDSGGTDHKVTIKGSTLYKGKEKVGTIDGGGNFTVELNGVSQNGALKNLDPSQVQGVSLTEKKGKKTIQSLEMDKEKVAQGSIYFDDGEYTVKNGKLYRPGEKESVGTTWVIREKSGLTGIRYKYTDKSGKESSGDLMDGNFATQGRKEGDMDMRAGEGTMLQVGKKMFGGKKRNLWLGFGASTKEFYEAYKMSKGWKMTGGGRLTPKLRALKKAGKLNITEDEIKLLQAVAQVESYGNVQTINSWDSDKMSMGFKQFTAAGKLQDLITRAEDAFKKHGIEIMKDADGNPVKKEIKKRPNKGSSVKAPWLKGMQKADDLRNSTWALRFMEAGLEDDVVVKQTEKAMEYLTDIIKPVDRKKANAKFFDKPVVKAILFEVNNNRPAYVKPVIRAVQKRAKASGTLDDFKKILKEEIENIYKKNWEKHSNGSTEEEGRAKGARIYDKIDAVF